MAVLLAGVTMRDFLRENGRVVGIRASADGTPREYRADLVIGADGRNAATRKHSGFPEMSSPQGYDVLWFKVASPPTNQVSLRLRPPVIHHGLGQDKWLLASATEAAEKPRMRSLPARVLDRLDVEIAKAKERFRLPADAPVCTCYEAWRDGFWLHRALTSKGIVNVEATRVD